MSSIVNGFIIFSLILTLAYFIGLLTVINDHEENKCDMTFMFEYPQFVRVSNKIDEKYQKYGLYAYSEGRMTEKTRNMYFDGIPVLFIPGNAGSHRQVRSLASVALRKAINSRTPFHFDYFTVDLNGELSGLNGALLLDQLAYVNHSVHRILELYQAQHTPPKSIILFAHSMGGVIARRFVADLPPGSDLVSIVLTLATPHKRPPVLLDSFLHEFYKGINITSESAINCTFISLTGGYNDLLVPSFLTGVSNNNNNSLNIVTTHIPRSWLPADHLCILWCKQTILALNRALFDSVDPKTKQISQNHTHRYLVFHHHLVQHSGTSSQMRNNYALRANIRNDGEWVEPFGHQYTIQLLHGTKEAKFYMVRLLNQPQNEALTLVAVNMETVDWVFVCGAHIPRGNSRVCEKFAHLTQLSEISPSVKYKRRTLRVDLHKLMRNHSEWTHVVFRVLPTDEPVVFHVDVYNANARRHVVTLPHLFSLKRNIIIDETPEKAIHFDLMLPQLEHVVQSYQLFVEAIKCTNEFHHATASLIVPWGHQDNHKYFVAGDYKPLHVRLYDSKPPWALDLRARIQLTLDPSCRYRISIRSSIFGTLGQMARFYTPLLLGNVAAVILMTLNSQLKNLSKEQTCQFLFVAIKDGAKPYYIITIVKLLSRFFGMKALSGFFAVPDSVILAQDGTDFFLLPLLLYVCSVGIVWLLSIGLCCSLVVFETTIHKMALKFLARTVSFTVSWSDYLMTALHKLPFVVAGAILCLSLTTTGSLALCLGMVFYFMRLTQLSQDYIEELVWYYVRKLGKRLKKSRPQNADEAEPAKKADGGNDSKTLAVHNAMFFHATLFLIWSIVTLINIPSVLTWAHNFKYSPTLQPDPSFLPGFVLSLCALPLWQLELPKIEKKWYNEVGQIVFGLGVISLIYAPVSIFRLNYTLTGVFVVVTIHQLLGLNREDLGIEVPVTEEPRVSYDTMKTKLE